MGNSSLSTSTKAGLALPGFIGRYKASLAIAMQEALSQDGDPVLYNMLRYHMGWLDIEGRPSKATEGKAIRPVLCLFACQCTGGSWERALPAAVALELIHNFSLIHDDIQDEDRKRHGRPTLWSVWGQPKALIVGNVLRIVADKAMGGLLQEGLSYSRATSASRLLVQSYLDMIDGQYLDLSYEKCLDASVDNYSILISLKTGALIRCALQVGALIGTEDTATPPIFRRCGEFLGEAFQIRDDYLGIWGDEEVTGKAVGADIRRKKKSFPVVYTLEQARGRDKELLRTIYSKETLDGEDVDNVLCVMDKVEARRHSEKLIEERCDQALQVLAEARLTPQAWDEFNELAEFLLTRRH